MAHDVFICHSSKDKKIADAICAKLEQNKIRCWIAPRDVIPGSDFAESIVAAIHASKVTVFVFSGHSNVSPHVSHELERSVSLGLPILPFRVEDVKPSPSLEYFISSAHWLDALTPPLEQHIDRLVDTVAKLLEREPPIIVPTGPGSGHPQRKWLLAGLGVTAVVVAAVLGVVLTRGNSPSTGSHGPTSSPTSTATATNAAPFADEFTRGVGAGWSWTNEDKSAWRTNAQGWLGIDTQEAPPLRNILLRPIPGSTYKVNLRLRFPASASGFAGLVLMGDDPETRLEFGWTKQGLTATVYHHGALTSSTSMYTRDAHVGADRDVRLIFEVSNGTYKAQYYDSKYAQYLDFGTEGDVSQTFTHIGLLAYRTTGSGASTAWFDRIAFYS